MKTNIRTIALALLAGIFSLIAACTAPRAYTLRGTFEGLPDGTRVTLTPAATHQDEQPIAETTLAAGAFEIRGQLDGPRLFGLRVGEGAQLIFHLVMLEPGEITVQAGESPRDLRVTGSPAHLTYLEKMSFRERLNEAHADYNHRHADIARRIGAARVAKDQALMNSLMQTPEYAAFEADERAFFRRVGEEIPATIRANKDTYWGPLLALVNHSYFTVDDSSTIAMYNEFPEEVKNSHYGQILHRAIFPERLLDKPLPTFTLPDRDGTMHAAATLRTGKRLVLVDFWASWCAPCRREIPNLKALYAKYAPLGLEIISISIDENIPAWHKALDEEQMPWPQLLDNASLFSSSFYGKTIPALFLVDAAGTVISDRLRGEALQEKIASILSD
jgi:thiol-disulfide isomerase/thioredoxin